VRRRRRGRHDDPGRNRRGVRDDNRRVHDRRWRRDAPGQRRPGFEISIEGGSNLAPGRYTLVVDDKSSSHNFHLTGPGGVDVSTSVEAEGQQSFEVELTAGEYRFVCDPHASSMNGTFTVG